MPQCSSAAVAPRRSNERKSHEFERSPYTSVSMSALSYSATNRLVSLSKPKRRKDTTIRDGFSRYYSNPQYSGVSHAAANAECTSRLEELAAPVKLHKEHRFELPCPRPISRGALNYHASTKVHELAAPRRAASAR